jgi:hypothetical protein
MEYWRLTSLAFGRDRKQPSALLKVLLKDFA